MTLLRFLARLGLGGAALASSAFAADYEVNQTGDSGSGSLRSALALARLQVRARAISERRDVIVVFIGVCPLGFRVAQAPSPGRCPLHVGVRPLRSSASG